ncbi:MAG TPA: translocation/assembly module TamB domain-containing protein [Polyangiales bacterium]|nr:translocation/assembly module TamB domain-containing protein [Polyangiales bacterium]
MRAWTRTTLEELLDSLLAGDVQIDRIERLSLGGVLAKGITVHDPQGRVVLRAKTLELGLAPLALLHGKLRFTHGRLEDGRIHAFPSEQAALSLFDAFLPVPSTAPKTEPSSGGLEVAFEAIHVLRCALYGAVPGLEGIDATLDEARGEIVVEDELRVRVWQVQARMRAPYADATIAQATYELDTGPLRMSVHARVQRPKDKLRLALTYSAPPDAKDHLDLRVALDPAQPELLSEIGLLPPDVLISPVRGSVHLAGPLEALDFSSGLSTDAGELSLRGALPRTGTTVIVIESRALALDKLIAWAPAITLGLGLDVQAPPEGPMRLALRAPKLDLMGVELSDAHAAATYEDERLTLGKSSVRYGGGKIDVSGRIDASAGFALRVRANVPDLARSPTVRETGLRGGIRTDVTIYREDGELIFDGSVGWVKPEYSFYGATNEMVLEGVVRTDESLSKLSIDASGSSWGTTVLGYSVGDFDYKIKGASPKFSADFALIDRRARSADAHLELTLGKNDSYRFVLFPAQVGVKDRAPWRAKADVTLDREAVTFNEVFLENGVQRLDLTGAYSFTKTYRVDSVLQHFDVGGLRELSGLDLADLDGVIDGKLALTGTPGHPRIDASGQLREGQFLGMTGLAVDMTMKSVEGRFDVDTQLFLADKSRLGVYAGGEPGEGADWSAQIMNGSYSFGLDFDRVPFEVARPWLAWMGIEPPPGTISASVRGAGSVQSPELDMKTEIHGLEWAPWPKLDLALDLTHDGGMLTLQRLEASDAHGQIAKLTGFLESRVHELFDPATLRTRLGTRPFELALAWQDRRLDLLPAPLRVDVPMPSSGSVRIAQTDEGPMLDVSSSLGWPVNTDGISACGTSRHPEAELTLNAVEGRTTAKLTARLDDEQLAMADFTADTPVAGWVSGVEALYLPRTSFTLNAETPNTEEIPLLCEYLTGPLRVDVSALDAFADPPELSVEVQSSSLQLVAAQSQVQRLGALRQARVLGNTFKLAASAGVDGPSFSMLADLTQREGGRLRVSGSIPREAVLPTGQPQDTWPLAKLDIEAVKSELSSLLIGLPISVRANGQLDGKAQLRYEFAQDKVGLGGALALSKGTLVIGSLGQELSDVGGRLALHDNVIELEDLEMRDFDGRLNVDGKLTFPGLRELDTNLTVRLREFPIRRESAQVSRLTGSMNLRATTTPERTLGELKFGELRVNLPNDLGQGLQSLDPHPDIAVKGQEAAEEDANPHRFELRVQAKDPSFRVLRNDLSAEVAADVTVRYPSLSLEGGVEIDRGAFELYGKRFELRESRLAFDAGETIDPLVSINAVYQSGGDEIGVRVEGRLSSPRISFSHSNPAITDPGAIIAQLLGARPSDPRVQNADASGAAAGILAGATAGLLTQSVRDEFGGALPVLSLESNSQTLRTARIRAGVQLDQLIQRLGPLRRVVTGAYVEGFVAPGASGTPVDPAIPPQSRGGGLLELRFPKDLVGTFEYRPVQNYRLDLAWEP